MKDEPCKELAFRFSICLPYFFRWNISHAAKELATISRGHRIFPIGCPTPSLLIIFFCEGHRSNELVQFDKFVQKSGIVYGSQVSNPILVMQFSANTSFLVASSKIQVRRYFFGRSA